MRYLEQLAIVFLITLIGEFLNILIPLPIPGSIYGFLIMLFCLQFKIIKIEKVKALGDFLLDIMTIMFIPTSVGLVVIWREVSGSIFKLLLICFITTIIVMVVTAKASDKIIREGGNEDEGNAN